MLVGDITESDPGEALQDMGNTPKVGVGLDLVFREALEQIGNPYSTETTLKFFIRWKALKNKLGNPPKRSRDSL